MRAQRVSIFRSFGMLMFALVLLGKAEGVDTTFSIRAPGNDNVYVFQVDYVYYVDGWRETWGTFWGPWTKGIAAGATLHDASGVWATVSIVNATPNGATVTVPVTFTASDGTRTYQTTKMWSLGNPNGGSGTMWGYTFHFPPSDADLLSPPPDGDTPTTSINPVPDDFIPHCPVSGDPSNTRRNGNGLGIPLLVYATVPPVEFIGGSTANAITGGYRHDATDFRAAGDPASCRSCGGSAVGGSDMPGLTLKRYHRYEWASVPSSLGPGVFLSYDQSLVVCNDGSLAWYDPAGAFPVILTPSATDPNHYENLTHDLVSGVSLSGAVATQPAFPAAFSAVGATVAMYDGRQYTFEFVNLTETQRVGRLTAIVDTAGRATTIRHTYAADYSNFSGDLAHLWDIDSVTDASGRSVSFDHGATLVGGRSVITRAHLPTGDTIFYWYNQAPLGLTGGTDIQGFSGATLPGGDTVSIGAALDGGLVRLSIDDPCAEGTHRRKTVWLTPPGTPDARTQSTTGYQIRRIDNGAGETIYRCRVEPDGSLWTTVMESGGELTRLAYTATGAPVHAERATAWDWAQPTSTYTWEASDTWTYDLTKRPVASANALGNGRSAVYDPISGQPSTITYEDGSTESYQYNALGLPIVQVDRAGRRTESAYDAQGNLLSRTTAAGTASAVTTTAAYNALGLVTCATDGRGFATTYGYSPEGWLTSVTEPADGPGGTPAVTRFTYDTLGRRTSMVDPSQRTTTYAWDVRNRLISTTYADGSTETVTYGSASLANLPVRRTDRDGRVTMTDYDDAGRVIAVRLAASSTAADAGQFTLLEGLTYQPGTTRPLTTTRDGTRTTHAYDHRGREITTTVQSSAAASLATAQTYDVAGHVVAQTDAFHRRTLMVYDVNGRLVRTVRELVPGGVVATADPATLPRSATANPPYVIEDTQYDAEGDMVARTDANGIRTTCAYDAQGRMTASTESADAQPATTSFAYDAAGNRTAVTSPRGVRVETTYTARNLVATMTEAAGSASAAVVRTVTYTPTKQVATETDALGRVTTFTYGTCCDRLKKIADPAGFETAFTYDFVGNRVSVTDANGLATVTAYDSRNRPVRVTNAAGETTTTTFDDDLTDGVGLDAQPAVQTVLATLGFGPGATGTAIAVTNPLNQTMIEIRDGLGRPVRRIDPLGQVTALRYDQVVTDAATGATLVATTATDALQRSTAQWADGLGRARLQIDAAGQITRAGFDGAGNPVSIADPNQTGWTAVYSPRNFLLSRTDTRAPTPGVTAWTYDADGNRLSETDATGQTETTDYDLRNRRLAVHDRLGQITRFSYDAVGNLLSITDAEGGVTTYAYDSRNLLVQETFPGPTGGTRSYSYDPGRRLLTRTQQTASVGGN